MKKETILIVGVLALGAYLFWRNKTTKKNFYGLHENKYKQAPIQDNLAKFGLPKFGVPTYIEKK